MEASSALAVLVGDARVIPNAPKRSSVVQTLPIAMASRVNAHLGQPWVVSAQAAHPREEDGQQEQMLPGQQRPPLPRKCFSLRYAVFLVSLSRET